MSTNRISSKKGAPWGIIVLFLIIFFPIGIALMIGKLHKEAGNYAANGRKTAIVGYFSLGLSLMYFILALQDGIQTTSGESALNQMMLITIVLLAGGFVFIRLGNKYKAIGLKYARYLPCIVNSQTGALERIASSLGYSYETVYTDIQTMIDLGLLPDSYINDATKCVVSPLIEQHPSSQTNETQEERTARTIKCPNCGGMNTVYEAACICEFCGSSLD